MSQPEITKASEEMTLQELLTWITGAVNRFTDRARAAQAALDGDLTQLAEMEAFKVLQAEQPVIVKAIFDAEMNRLAAAMALAVL